MVIDFRPAAPIDIQAFYARLEEIGTSIQVGEGDGIYRMHIHVPTGAKGDPEKYVETLGTIKRVMFENLMEQLAEQSAQAGGSVFKLAPVIPGQLAVVAVAPGSGIAEVFASLGVAAIVEGGQTMNPSTQDILSAVDNLPTDEVIILPNNKNIVLAAEQASALTAKTLSVVPTTSVPQGIAALLALDPEGDLETVSQAMRAAVGEIKTVELTVATRSVELDGVQVREGQVIGLLNGKLAVAGDDLEAVLLEVLDKAGAAHAELVSLYYGAGMIAIQANKLGDRVRETWPRLEVEIVARRPAPLPVHRFPGVGMARVRIVTDSAARFSTPDFLHRHPVTVAPMTLRCGAVTLTDDPYAELAAAQALFDACDPPPVAEPPTVDAFTEVYTQLQKDASHIVSIHTSSLMTGTYENARQASLSFLGRCNIQVLDSQAVSLGLGLLVRAAAEAARA